MVDVMGNVPGDFMNLGFLWLKPFQLILDKYVGLLDNIDDDQVVKNFLRMEKWIFDSPDQAGEMFRKFVKDMYQGNKLVKGELEVAGQRVNLKNITMPVLNIFAQQDHLVPPSSSSPLKNLVGAKDYREVTYPVGHIGMYVSSKTQRELAPTVAKWLQERNRSSGTVQIGSPSPEAKALAAKLRAIEPVKAVENSEAKAADIKKKKPSSRRIKSV